MVLIQRMYTRFSYKSCSLLVSYNSFVWSTSTGSSCPGILYDFFTTQQPSDPGDCLQEGHISSEFVKPGQVFFPNAAPTAYGIPSVAT